MVRNFSIFDASDWLSDEIYVHGLESELKEIIAQLGGVICSSKKIGVNYSTLKDWPMGRSPISIVNLNALLNYCPVLFKEKMKTKIDLQDILLSCRYSPHKIKFPKFLSTDLAYVVGLILGDGSLAGDHSNLKGNWGFEVYFDSIEHQKIYCNIIQKELGVEVKSCLRKNKNCYCAYLNSKILHWFFRCYFDMCNGYKASKISIPTIILDDPSDSIMNSFLQGLFDSDGTITNQRSVSYSSTSQLIAEQVMAVLNRLKIIAYLNIWVKSEQYLPLYTVRFSSKVSVKRFAECINFRHPAKRNKLILAVGKL